MPSLIERWCATFGRGDFDPLFRWLLRPGIRSRLGSFGVLEEPRSAALQRRCASRDGSQNGGGKVSSCDKAGFCGGVKQVKPHAVCLREPIRVFILDYLPNELRTAPGEPFKRLVDVVRSGNVWDNAAMESFFSSLKTERIGKKLYRTRDDARADVFDSVGRFYNPVRRHSTIGYVSPVEFENKVRVT